MDEILGPVIGFGIVALLMLVGVLPIYFILKKISGSKTTFAEDLREYFTAGSEHRPEAARMLFALDSVESIVLQVYKYALIIGLVLGSVFIVWFFINVESDAESSFLRLYFGAAYLFLAFWVIGSFVILKRRQAQSSSTGITQTTLSVSDAPIRASLDPPPPSDGEASPSKDSRPAASRLTPQQIVIVVMVFVLAVASVSVLLLMWEGWMLFS